MEAAKLAVAKWTSKRGHKTYVEETVRPAVTRETIKPTRHEIVTEAVDKEVHRHHYHTTIQPLSHKEVLPTKHTHNLLAVSHRDFTDKTREINLNVQDSHAKELGLFVNHSATLPTTHTRSVAPTVVGEHVHHHIHEIVQPIIFKETHVPEVVHTTIPIHEIHHKEAVHHQMSELSLMQFEEYMAHHQPGKPVTYERYEGAPRQYNPKLTIDPSRYMLKSTSVDTTPPRNSTSTPPLSPASAASSSSMPSTPRGHVSDEPGVRNSEDSMDDFALSPTTTTTTKTQTKTQHFRNGQLQQLQI